MNHNSCDQCISVKIAQMIEAYSLSADLSEFVEALAELCGNPLHVADRSYKVLACSNCENVDDEVWRDTAELGYMSSKIITDAIKMHQSTHPKKTRRACELRMVRRLYKILPHGKLSLL